MCKSAEDVSRITTKAGREVSKRALVLIDTSEKVVTVTLWGKEVMISVPSLCTLTVLYIQPTYLLMNINVNVCMCVYPRQCSWHTLVHLSMQTILMEFPEV